MIDEEGQAQPFLSANRMARPSYVSLQSALACFGLIPDVVPATTGITAARPGRRETPLGVFAFRHLAADLFTGYRLAKPDLPEAARML